MKDTKISIVIPTYKRERQIQEILKSLNNQLDQQINLEVILCDSGSNYDYNKFPLLKKILN